MNRTDAPSDQKLIADIRSKVRNNIRLPVTPQSLQAMLFRIDLKEYCVFLASLPPVDSTDYREVYRILLRYSKLEADSGEGSIQGKPLTVGLMLQKASDLIYHDEEYPKVPDAFTALELDAVDIGEYIVDVLLVKPVILLEVEKGMQLDDMRWL